MYFALARAGRLSETAQTPRAWSLLKNRASIRAGKHGWPSMFVPMGLYRDGMEVANQGKDEPFQLPVFALFACAGGSGSVKPEAISFSRSRSDSPTPANTCAQASRRRCSAVAAIPEIRSRDWWSSEATVASIHWFETFSSLLLYCSAARSPICPYTRSISFWCAPVMDFQE